MALDRALQVPCAIALVRAFLQEELFTRAGHAEQELAFGCFQHPLLDLSQFDIQHFLELFFPKWMKNHHFVETIHEFGRKLAAGGFDGGALYLLVQSVCGDVFRLNEAHATIHQFGDLAATQV